MTDSDDKLSRRYRELVRDEPPPELDAAILAASRRAVGAGPRSRKSSWMVPASIAAVLVLGIGVSLRMQLEQPGVETSVPSRPVESTVARAPEPQAPPSAPEAAQAPPPEPAAKQKSTAGPPRPAAKPMPEKKALAAERAQEAEGKADAGARKDAAEPNPFADAPIAMQPAVPASPPAVALSVPAAAPAPPPRAQSSTSVGSAAAPAPQAAAAPRAKREAMSDNAAAREAHTAGAPADPDPARELDRIAKLREAARHEEADRALAEFRRRHPDYRIPEAMWERVKPR